MTELVPVTVYLRPAQLGALKSLARRHHVEPRDLIAELVRRALPTPPAPVPPPPKPKPVVDELPPGTWKPPARTIARGHRPWTEQDHAHMVKRNGEGATDTAIAVELGRAQPFVSIKRRAAGLPVVPQRPRGKART